MMSDDELKMGLTKKFPNVIKFDEVTAPMFSWCSGKLVFDLEWLAVVHECEKVNQNKISYYEALSGIAESGDNAQEWSYNKMCAPWQQRAEALLK